MNNKKIKFLIVRLSSLGDIVHSLPAVNALRKTYPNAQIDWLTGNKGVEILSLIKEINNFYVISPDIINKLREEKYDYVIDIQGLFKTGLASLLVGGKEVVGFKNTREFASVFYSKKINVGNLFNTKTHIVDLNLKLISHLVEKNIDINFLIPEIKDSSIDLNLTSNKKNILVLPATTWESKMWSLEYWYKLIENLSIENNIYLTASNSDLDFIKPLLDKLSEKKVSFKNLVGKTKIKDLIFLIQNMDLVIGLDSGALHLASAIKNDFKKPDLIGIYGSTSIYRNGPYKNLKNTFYKEDLNCIACRKKTCPLKHHKCMNEIFPENIIEFVKNYQFNKSVLDS